MYTQPYLAFLLYSVGVRFFSSQPCHCHSVHVCIECALFPHNILSVWSFASLTVFLLWIMLFFAPVSRWLGYQYKCIQDIAFQHFTHYARPHSLIRYKRARSLFYPLLLFQHWWFLHCWNALWLHSFTHWGYPIEIATLDGKFICMWSACYLYIVRNEHFTTCGRFHRCQS